MKRLNLLFAMTALAVLRATTAAVGQTGSEAEPGTTDPCRAAPSDKAIPHDRQESLTDQLDRCNGVLEPPPHADREIEEQPPETGRTPVIPPDQLPEQQPDPV